MIVGDFDVDAAAWLVSGWFGRWPVKADAGRLTAPPVPPPGARPLPEKVIITPRPVTSRMEVAFACRLGFPATARERVAHQMIAGLLGGYLSTQIREAAGAAYSVASEASAFPGGGAHLSVEMSVDSHRLRDALRVLRAEIDALAKGRIDKNALGQVRWALAGQESLHYQTGFSTAAEILEAFSLGVPLQALATDADEIARVTETDLARAFAPCLSSRVLSLIGNEATIRAAM